MLPFWIITTLRSPRLDDLMIPVINPLCKGLVGKWAPNGGKNQRNPKTLLQMSNKNALAATKNFWFGL